MVIIQLVLETSIKSISICVQIPKLSCFLWLVRTEILVTEFCDTSARLSDWKPLLYICWRNEEHKKQRPGMFPTLLVMPEYRQERECKGEYGHSQGHEGG